MANGHNPWGMSQAEVLDWARIGMQKASELVPLALKNLTDEQIADCVECEFSETREWPEGDAATFRAILKHAPAVAALSQPATAAKDTAP